MQSVTVDREGLVALNDRRLQRFLRADGDEEAERELARMIVEHARPLVARIVSRYTRHATLMRAEDADDVLATIDLRLVQKLREVRLSPEHAIANLQSYVATVAYNAVNDFLRARFPERARLKKRIRYVLTTDERLAMWMTLAGPACGLREWEGREDVLDELPPPRAQQREDHELVPHILRAAGAPVLVDALVDALVEAWNVRDAQEVGLAEVFARPLDEQVEANDFARVLWREILELRPMQRQALLLNLRYNGEFDFVATLMLSGIARFSEIAAALEMTEEELAGLWKELPLDDLRIASRLNVTRQQVINLRRAARNRLTRRLPR